MYNLMPRKIRTIVAEKAEIYVSQFNLRKFYALSQSLVLNEQQDGREAYFNLDKEEFIEFVYRVAEHVYDKGSYE